LYWYIDNIKTILKQYTQIINYINNTIYNIISLKMNRLYENFGKIIPSSSSDLAPSLSNHNNEEYTDDFEEERKIVCYIALFLYAFTNTLLLYLSFNRNIRTFAKYIIISYSSLFCLIVIYIFKIYPYDLYMCFIMFMIVLTLTCRVCAYIQTQNMNNNENEFDV